MSDDRFSSLMASLVKSVMEEVLAPSPPAPCPVSMDTSRVVRCTECPRSNNSKIEVTVPETTPKYKYEIFSYYDELCRTNIFEKAKKNVAIRVMEELLLREPERYLSKEFASLINELNLAD